MKHESMFDPTADINIFDLPQNAAITLSAPGHADISIHDLGRVRVQFSRGHGDGQAFSIAGYAYLVDTEEV